MQIRTFLFVFFLAYLFSLQTVSAAGPQPFINIRNEGAPGAQHRPLPAPALQSLAEQYRREQEGVSQGLVNCLVSPNLCSISDLLQDISVDARALTNKSASVADPLFSVGQNFELLADAYRRDVNGSSEEVKAHIGHADNTMIVNTCAIRLTYAMNQSGIDGVRIRSGTSGLYLIRDNVIETRGPYAIRVAELANYLLRKYGRPSVALKIDLDMTMEERQRPFINKKGVILYVVNWSDATGHFDLWDGSAPVHDEYFDAESAETEYVFLWE